jgi:hypothetical protein
MSKSKGIQKMPKLVDGGTKSRHFKHNNKKDEELQKYDDIEQINIDADFSSYKNAGRATNTGVLKFKDTQNKFNIEEKIDLLNKCIDWLDDEEGEGNDVLMIGDISAYLGITGATWYGWGKRDERIKELQTLIREKLMSRLHYRGANSKTNPVFTIFSLKSLFPTVFPDKQIVEQTNIHKIDYIGISEAKTNKELEQPELKELEEHEYEEDE